MGFTCVGMFSPAGEPGRGGGRNLLQVPSSPPVGSIALPRLGSANVLRGGGRGCRSGDWMTVDAGHLGCSSGKAWYEVTVVYADEGARVCIGIAGTAYIGMDVVGCDREGASWGLYDYGAPYHRCAPCQVL